MITDKDIAEAEIIVNAIKAGRSVKDIAFRVSEVRTESAEQARKEAAENGIIFMQERLVPGVFTDIMLDEMRAAILGENVKEGKTDAEKLAIAVKALESASISIAKTDGDYDALCVVRDALKEIQ
jgi:ribosomal protein S2